MAETESTVAPEMAQAELERMNRLFAMLSHINRSIVRIEETQALYDAACRIAVENGGFDLAWVVLIEPGSGRAVPMAVAGAATLEALESLADEQPGFASTDLALRDERPFVFNEIADDLRLASCRSVSERWGIHSGGAFPLRLDGAIIGTFSVMSALPGFFRETEIHLLEEVADDLSFALEVIRREEKRIATETRMRYLAFYDAQTGMPGRILFEERLAEICRETAGKTLAVLVVNLRSYHGILQLLGHGVGQEIIRSAAARLESILPAMPVARVTESKFAVVWQDPAGLDMVEEFAWKMANALADGVHADGQEVFLDPFVGISVFPRDGTASELLRYAMQAAAADHDSSSLCRFFQSDMDGSSRLRFSLDAALRRALEHGEFMLHYQPQVDLSSGRVIGAEALLRWQRPGHGLVSPLDFIPLLEENGLIVEVGEWVMLEACRRSKQWQDDGLQPIRIAVNLSARQFCNNEIEAMVRRVLDVTGLDPRLLELEVTESIVLHDSDAIINTLRTLAAEGISFALDDFGTGYSSLSYLRRLPVRRIKVDRSFVTHITSSPGDAAIVRAVVGMAHSLGLSVIAEGVETEGQLGFLRGIGCEEIQGYYFSRPLPENEFKALLRDGRCIPSGKDGHPERVLLLLDDEPHILSALNRLLRREGYRIISTTSAREAFDLLAAHQPGVVLCDQRMPEMTGTEFLRRVREIYPDTMRIVLSGYTELNSVIDAVNKGAVYKFLTKPWDDQELSENIRDAFRIYELSHENRDLERRLLACEAAAGSLHQSGIQSG
ncbi:MAG: EAL domain-containing protein [Sulfuricella denitrificans]|nr:EAL domain-containing protein [Sulfuricella denitrificans]